MKVQPFDLLLNWVLKEYQENQSIFGIHRSLFYTPKQNNPYASELFGYYLATPIGPAAGPHTQLAQNIVCAWLSGGRFMELKTVQIMDQLEIPRPCIDMEDEGYNVEWSQELLLDQSAHEYINAWALIHILRRVLGFEGQVPFGTIFNMSVGYNLAGIQSSPMQRFMDRMADASAEIAAIQETIRTQFPNLPIPSQLTNSVTLSTMHGCPPDEIEQIARYLLTERDLHTIVKLNPTLLGKERVLNILHDDLDFTEIQIPDAVFEHDLQYGRAIELIKSLQATADERGLTFGVKLSNTLAMANHRGELPGDEMYMSGRALYPITINLFQKFAREFEGNLNVSYSGGADALNVAGILAAGARPVTVASDLLKPGGYSRLLQYLENLEAEMQKRGASSLDELAQDKLSNLEAAAAEALRSPRYKKSYFPHGLPKVESGLGLFDCITAPCVEQCAVLQDVPEYAWLISQGEYDRALEVILARNPLPAVTGYVCTHLCQTRCTRNNYDEPVAIRALKRFAVEKGRKPQTANRKSQIANHESRITVAIIGAGPSGLSAAAFLALHGVKATIFEAKDVAGGMTRLVPSFRLPDSVIQEDVERIAALGVEIKFNYLITRRPEELLREGFDAVYIASGFQKDAPLYIQGIDGEGVFAALDLLERARRGEKVELGQKALVIGGGDTALDAARVAQRYTGRPATIVYRRSENEMPASAEEKRGAFEEGAILKELASPTRIIRRDGRVAALECIQNRLGELGTDGRRRPVPIQGSEFQIEADSVILAIGQKPDLDFLGGSSVTLHRNGSIAVDPETGRAGAPHIYAGGDVVEGPESIIAACAHGRRAAEAICAEFGIRFEQPSARPVVLSEQEIVDIKRVRARKLSQIQPEMIPPAERTDFILIEATLTEKAAQAEAARCLQCAAFCDKCIEVCPNRANYSYRITPFSTTVPLLACQDGELVVTGREPFVVTQERQILHLDDFCNQCGNCATFCVHNAKPYAEKPRLFLKERDFQLEDDNAFFIQGNTIRRRENGRESRLSVQNGRMTFENTQVRVLLSHNFEIEAMAPKESFEGALPLREAAEMTLIFNGVTAGLPFMLV